MVQTLETRISRGTGGSDPKGKPVAVSCYNITYNSQDRKQPNRLLMDMHIRKLHHVHTMESYPAIKEGNPAVGNNLERLRT